MIRTLRTAAFTALLGLLGLTLSAQSQPPAQKGNAEPADEKPQWVKEPVKAPKGSAWQAWPPSPTGPSGAPRMRATSGSHG